MRQRWLNVYPSVANNGTTFYFLTNKDAPQYKLVTVDITHPAEQRVFKDILPEDKDAHLEDVLAVNGDHFAVVYKRNVRKRVFLYLHLTLLVIFELYLLG